MNAIRVHGQSHSIQGLHGIARLKGIHFQGDERSFSLGPSDQNSLLTCLLAWHKMHPSAAGAASLQILPKDDPPWGSPSVGLRWSGVKWNSHWAKTLGQDLDGSCEWKQMLSAPQLSPAPPRPSPWFGRKEEDERLTRLLEASQIVVLEGLPLIGRTSFVRAYANGHSYDWAEGVEFIDVSPLQGIKAHRQASAASIVKKWRSSHKLYVLENATHQAEWLAEALSLIRSGQALCSILILPVEEFLDRQLIRFTLSVLSDDAFHSLWLSLFGESSQAHRDLMNVRTGKIPGVVTYLHKELAGRSEGEIESALDQNFTRWQPLLRRLSQRADDLSQRAASRLRVLSLLSAQFSLPMAIEPLDEENTSMNEVAELLTSGWMTLEQKGYRIPRPYAMAARGRLKPTRDDELRVCRLLVQTARNLSKLGEDLVPSRSSRDFQELIWTSFEAVSWLSVQPDQGDLALEAAVLFWLPTLTEGYSQEYLAFTDRLAKELREKAPSLESAMFWEARGRHLRADGRLRASLEAHELGMSDARALGLAREELWNLQFKGTSLSLLGQVEEADSIFEELIPRWRMSGTTKDLAHGLCSLGQHYYRNRRMDSLPEVLVEAHSAARRSEEPGLLVMIKELQGWSSFNAGEYSKAADAFEEADLIGKRTLNLRRDLVSLGQALVVWQTGDRSEAIRMTRSILDRSVRIEKLSLFMLELNLSLMEVQSSQIEAGLERARSCYSKMISSDARLYLGDTLDLAALAAWRTGHASSAAILAGTAFHWQSRYGRGLQEYESGFRNWYQDGREALGDAAFQARHHAGANLDPMRLLELCRVDYSLVSQMLPGLTASPQKNSPLLSERQIDVVRLAAQGLSNREISAVLFLEEGTVKRHLHNAARELGVKGRVALVRKAKDLGLLS